MICVADNLRELLRKQTEEIEQSEGHRKARQLRGYSVWERAMKSNLDTNRKKVE